MSSYAKITFKGAGMSRARSMLVKILRDGAKFVLCERVNIEGDTIDDYIKGDTVYVPQHMIQKATISKVIPYTMNLHYGMLEPSS